VTARTQVPELVPSVRSFGMSESGGPLVNMGGWDRCRWSDMDSFSVSEIGATDKVCLVVLKDAGGVKLVSVGVDLISTFITHIFTNQLTQTPLLYPYS